LAVRFGRALGFEAPGLRACLALADGRGLGVVRFLAGEPRPPEARREAIRRPAGVAAEERLIRIRFAAPPARSCHP
jgi:hypothetical protein